MNKIKAIGAITFSLGIMAMVFGIALFFSQRESTRAKKESWPIVAFTVDKSVKTKCVSHSVRRENCFYDIQISLKPNSLGAQSATILNYSENKSVPKLHSVSGTGEVLNRYFNPKLFTGNTNPTITDSDRFSEKPFVKIETQNAIPQILISISAILLLSGAIIFVKSH